MITREEMFLSPAAHLWVVMLATAKAYLKRVSAYAIELIRWPLGPIFLFAAWRVTYEVSGRTHLGDATVSGFLLVGVLGNITWSSSLWASGYALEHERYEGTSGALFLSPASRAAVVAGYGLGSFIWFLPSFIAIGVLGVVTGARVTVTDPPAMVASVACLVIASLAAGFTFSGLFVLSRRGNLIANFAQSPLFLLGGFLVPLSFLPGVMQPLAEALPISHAVTAMRETMLLGASFSAVENEVAATLGLSAVYLLIGLWGLRRVEHVAKRAGQIDLY